MATEKLRVVVIREELVRLTGDGISAVILGQMLYWSERVRDIDKYIEEERVRNPETNIQPTHGWIYKSAEDLAEETLLGLSATTVRRRMRYLVENGWLDERENPDNTWDKTRQYRVNIKKIIADLNALGLHLSGYPLLSEIADEHSERSADHPDDSSMQNECSIVQNDGSNVQNDGAIPEITTEITTETTTENTPAAENAREAIKPIEPRFAFEEELYSAFGIPIAKKKEKRKRPGKSELIDAVDMMQAIAKVCKQDLGIDDIRRQIAQAATELERAGYTPAQVVYLYCDGGWWYKEDWRGQRGTPPTPRQIVATISVGAEYARRKKERLAKARPVKGWVNPITGKVEEVS